MNDVKIDRVKLNQMLRAGKSGKECADYFGVTPPAITKAKKELNISDSVFWIMDSDFWIMDSDFWIRDTLTPDSFS